MKPTKKNTRSYDEHDTAVMDCAKEFDSVIGNDFDLIDMDVFAEVNDDNEDNWV